MNKILLLLGSISLANVYADVTWVLQIQNQTNDPVLVYSSDKHCFEAPGFESVLSSRGVLPNASSTFVAKENSSPIGHCDNSSGRFLNLVASVNGSYQNKFILSTSNKDGRDMPAVTYARGTPNEHIYSAEQSYIQSKDNATINVIIAIKPNQNATVSFLS